MTKPQPSIWNDRFGVELKTGQFVAYGARDTHDPLIICEIVYIPDRGMYDLELVMTGKTGKYEMTIRPFSAKNKYKIPMYPGRFVVLTQEQVNALKG